MDNYLLYESLKERIGVHTYDKYFMALCPFHESRVGHADSRPSFMVHADTYYCKGCGAWGTLEYLDRWLGGHEFDPTAGVHEREYPVLPKWRKWIDKYGSVENIAAVAHRLYCNHPELRSFFVKRGVHRFYLQGHFGWLDWWNLFPVYDQAGRIIDIVVRGDVGKGDTKYVLLKKSEEHTKPPVYVPDWTLFMQSKVVYVPYGILDAWAFRALGLASLTGTTGKSLSPDLLYPLQKEWVIVPDAGEEREAWQLKMELGSRARVQELAYPYRTKDPDGILHKHGMETLSQLLGVKHGQPA